MEHLIREQEVQKQRGSLRKNGESWKVYLGKVFTIDRILLLTVLIYQFGGQVQSFKTEQANVVQSQTTIAKQHEAVLSQMRAASELQQDTGQVVLELMAETDRLSKVSRTLEDRMNRTVTRSEFQSAIQQRLIPRLERIEQSLK
jgi:hypothetical protein